MRISDQSFPPDNPVAPQVGEQFYVRPDPSKGDQKAQGQVAFGLWSSCKRPIQLNDDSAQALARASV